MVVDRCDFKSGQLVAKCYTVQKLLGDGSFGVVYLVSDLSGNKFALKLLRLWDVPSEIRQPLIDRFDMEFHTGQIECANLVRSLAHGTIGGNPYIVMEYCPGGSLEPLLGKGDYRDARICHDILIGLSALHQHGKVHRDLKPENVLFKQNGMAALTDFGISGDRTHRMTQRNIFGKPNQIFGTYAYMPPEQANRVRGGATVLPTTDIWSFGVVAYQLLTGKLPFGKLESHNDIVIYQKRGEQGKWDRQTLLAVKDGKQWEEVIERCLIPDFKQRLQSTSEVMDLLPKTQSMRSSISPQRSQFYRPAATTNGYLLQIMHGAQYGTKYRLTDMVSSSGRVVTVGRQQGNVIPIRSDEHGYMSRRHCTIESDQDSGQWLIRDGQWDKETQKWSKSTNGTYVNSRPVGPEGYYLSPGDIITLGDVTLRFENY